MGGQKGEVNINGRLAGQQPQTRHAETLSVHPELQNPRTAQHLSQFIPACLGEISGRKALSPRITGCFPPEAPRAVQNPGGSSL